MVAIQSIISVLAMSLMVNATPANIVARGETVAVVTTFNAVNCADPARHQYLVDRNNPSSGHIAAGTCVSEAAYGSIAVDFVGARCQCKITLSSFKTYQQCSDSALTYRVPQLRSTSVELVTTLLLVLSLLSTVHASVSAAKLLQPISGELCAPKDLKSPVDLFSGRHGCVAVGVVG
jgi:hypothetical protein